MGEEATGSRSKWLRVRITLQEHRQLNREAKEARLSVADYTRSKLGLPISGRQKRAFLKAPEPPPGDPDNAVDIEELAKEIFSQWSPGGVEAVPMTMVQARREAKRRLMAANQK